MEHNKEEDEVDLDANVVDNIAEGLHAQNHEEDENYNSRSLGENEKNIEGEHKGSYNGGDLQSVSIHLNTFSLEINANCNFIMKTKKVTTTFFSSQKKCINTT